MLKNLKISKRAIIAVAVVAVVAIALLACFLFIDKLPRFKYNVFVPDTDNALLVTLEIQNPLFSKTDVVSLLVGDKQIEIYACEDASNQPTGDPLLDEGVLYIATGRGSVTYLTYLAEVATPGKHGNRGGISNNYAVFDGEQALLLPVSCYTYKPGMDQIPLIGEIGFAFDLPDGWEQVTPRETVKNPLWADIYAVIQDAFVFGEFEKVPDTVPGLDTFALSGSDSVNQDTLNGFNSLYEYYAGLFGDAPNLYSIIALPKPGAGAPQIIGGAGMGSVAASFDPDSPRDWQLLSHRMFHAFFDSIAPAASFQMPTNLWFYEGLATYYEIMSMDALPESLKMRLDIDVNRHMALLFDKYLYMRIKDPMTFGFPPMMEEEITSNGEIEFLHYTIAPLLVKLLEDSARKKGVESDAALKFCVNNSRSFDERFVAFEAAIELLGEDDAGDYIESYLLRIGVPPLWDLKLFQPSDEVILAELNDIEQVLGSWFQKEKEDYHIDIVTYSQLQEMIENIDERRVLFLTVEASITLEDYCPALYALLNDYFYRAKLKDISYDDPDLRHKMFTVEDGKK